MYSIDLMVEEHKNINRMLAVIQKICCGILDGKDVDDTEHREIIGFVCNYADLHHHGKEEKILFPEMVNTIGRIADQVNTNGMLVEHQLGRAHVMAWETALNMYKQTPKTEIKLDIITEAMGYARLLQIHTEKENNAVYPLSERMLPKELCENIDDRVKEFEAEQTRAGVQEKYLDLLARLEEKYMKER